MKKFIPVILVSALSTSAIAAETTYKGLYSDNNANRNDFQGPSISIQEELIFGNVEQKYESSSSQQKNEIDYDVYLLGLTLTPIHNENHKLFAYYNTDIVSDHDSGANVNTDFDINQYGFHYGFKTPLSRNNNYFIIGYEHEDHNNNANYQMKEKSLSLKYEMNFYPTNTMSFSVIPEYRPIIETDLEQSLNSSPYDSEIEGWGAGGTLKLSKLWFKNTEASLYYRYFQKNLDGSNNGTRIDDHKDTIHSIGASLTGRF